jgi:Fe-Mn family superoxide dismutase
VRDGWAHDERMPFELPPLPYALDALAPHVSAETLTIHHGKHHAAYVAKLNALVAADPSLAQKSLLDLVRGSSGTVFNQAAQVYNHTFYWSSMSPPQRGDTPHPGGGEPRGPIAALIERDFGSFGELKERFNQTATGHFASGWCWLVQRDGGRLAVVDTHDADTPVARGERPLLTCDVWEHAYYVDYKNERAKYVAAWWNVANWDFANANLG